VRLREQNGSLVGFGTEVWVLGACEIHRLVMEFRCIIADSLWCRGMNQTKPNRTKTQPRNDTFEVPPDVRRRRVSCHKLSPRF
jgi:hypothetical protein